MHASQAIPQTILSRKLVFIVRFLLFPLLNKFLPRYPARTRRRIRARALDSHAVALGVTFDFEGLLVPKLDVALALPPTAGRALLVCEVDFLHDVTLLI